MIRVIANVNMPLGLWTFKALPKFRNSLGQFDS